MPSQDDLVFISRGQLTPEEKKLGSSVAQLVSDLTLFRRKPNHARSFHTEHLGYFQCR